MLMILGQSARGDHISPWAGLPWINVDDAYDSCGSCLNNNPSCLIELVCKYVLVVGWIQILASWGYINRQNRLTKRDNELHDQLS